MTSISGKLLGAYEKLAETLNKIPNGFSITEDGIHLKVLQWIFTEEEAKIASKMKLKGETPTELAHRINIPLEGLETKLQTMYQKGQIRAYKSKDDMKYSLMPFVVGIFEEQVARMDEEFAQLMEDYFKKAKYPELFDSKPSIHRVIPINRTVTPELSIYPYDIDENLLENAKSWGVRECICKKQKELLGERCSYSKNVCLVFSEIPNAFEKSTKSETISKEEAFELLYHSEEEGLIHNSMNIQSGLNYICNCCSCCCGVIRALTEWEQPLAFVKSNYQISIDKDLCIACGDCVDRCQFHALEVDDTCEVNLNKCVGCGVCAIICEEGALTLASRDQSEIISPPENIQAWMMQKAMSRRIDPSDLL